MAWSMPWQAALRERPERGQEVSVVYPAGRRHHGGVTTLLLIHGWLWDDMDAEHFWHQPKIVAGLRHHGFDVLTPDRLPRAPDWTAEATHLATSLPDRPVTVLAGSNGCSAAIRLALTHPDRVERLLLAWPATAHGPLDTRTQHRLADRGATPADHHQPTDR